tara:strand:- start:962 stop:2191 length:1230 start_codon:yes stop_codon:yes gene_type:complete
MPRNVYFSQGATSEKRLYEDITIEALKIYGHDVYYIPRAIVNTNAIFNEDTLSKFGEAFQIEMYVENTDGFEGDGELLSKFGVESRDSMTLVLASRRWEELIGRFQSSVEVRPQEGDLIYFPLANGLFEIRFVEEESPFYQLQNLPTFKLTCETFEYGNEAIDTGIDAIDSFETQYASRTQLTLGEGNGLFQVGEDVTQTNSTSGIIVTGEVATISTSDTQFNTLNTYTNLEVADYPTGYVIIRFGESISNPEATHIKLSSLSDSSLSYLEGTFEIQMMFNTAIVITAPSAWPLGSAVGSAGTVEILGNGYASGTTIEISSQVASDGSNTLFAPTVTGTTQNIVVPENIRYAASGQLLPRASYKIASTDAFSSIDSNDSFADNEDFESVGNNFIDFTETNPFGEPNVKS